MLDVDMGDWNKCAT